MKKLKMNYDISDAIYLYIWIMQKNKVNEEAIKIVSNYCTKNKGKEVLNDARSILCDQGYINEVKQTDAEFITAYEDMKQKPDYLINSANNKLFKENTIRDGIDYYNSHKDHTITRHVNKYKVEFKSNTVTILFNDNYNILQMDCTCKKGICKHKYAAIIAINNKYFDYIETCPKVEEVKPKYYLTELLKNEENLTLSNEAKEYIDKIKTNGPIDFSKYQKINAECLIIDVCNELVKQGKNFKIENPILVNNLIKEIITNNIEKDIEDYKYISYKDKSEDLENFIKHFLYLIYEYIGDDFFKENKEKKKNENLFTTIFSSIPLFRNMK